MSTANKEGRTAFVFPDELEAEEKKNAVETDELEVVVEDDTPPEDRNRRPMTEPPVEPTDEELASYSESVRSRFKHFTKGLHEERRAKEAALRERAAALQMAQAAVEENKHLKGSLTKNQEVLLEQAKRSVAAEVEDARRKYKEALEAFDTDGTIAAQQALTSAQMRAERIENFRPPPLQEARNEVKTEQRPPQAPVADPQLLAWQERNPWFGTNRKMTAYAIGLHEDLVGEGVAVGSKAYYDRIDADLNERFSDQMDNRNAAEAPKSQRTRSNVVAPATRSTATKRIVLTQSEVNIAKQLNVPLEAYARKVAESRSK